MIIRLKLGYSGKKFLINWPKKVTDFPKILSYEGDKYEFAMYDVSKEDGVDYECMFSSIDAYYLSANFGYMDVVDLNDLLDKYKPSKCQCGARFTSFPQFHMFFCALWKPNS